GVVGVVGGWVAAVGIILVASIMWIGLPGAIAEADRVPVAPMLAFFAGVAVYLALFNALMFVDSILIKRLTTEYFSGHAKELAASADAVIPWARGATGYHAVPSELADVQNAYYGAVQNLGRLSYQAIIAATFVVFPLISRSTFTDDKETTRRYVEITTRYSLMFALAIAVVMAANPVDILGLVYAPDYAQLGGPALAALALGNVAFSIFAIAGTILNGAGHTRDAIISAAITLVIAIVGDYLAISMTAGTDHVLVAAASVTGGAMVIGAVISGVFLKRRLGSVLPLASLARIALAAGVAIAVGRVLPFHGKLMTLVEAVIVGVTFLAVLVATRELGKRELDAIKAVRAKRGGGAPE
ncbi:MAG: oligosaccharide flippase family protein, partial [Proteobacteria bacterium]|nr:oligosaccharide flippase family protein [Pseudomonadota bacterium]